MAPTIRVLNLTADQRLRDCESCRGHGRVLACHHSTGNCPCDDVACRECDGDGTVSACCVECGEDIAHDIDAARLVYVDARGREVDDVLCGECMSEDSAGMTAVQKALESMVEIKWEVAS